MSLRRIALLTLAMAFSAEEAQAKTVSLKWTQLRGAVKYELQIMDESGKTVAHKYVQDTDWSGEVPPGVYTYQIRAYDKIRRPGKWSQPKALVVLPPPPEPTFPKQGSKIGVYHPGATTVLKWKPVEGATKYNIEVRRGKQLVLRQAVEAPQVDLPKLQEGEYKWKITPIIEAKGRLPASVANRRWEGPPSEEGEFDVEQKKIEVPSQIGPKGGMRPPPDKRMVFSWKKVEGGDAYEIEIIRKQDGRGPASAVVKRERTEKESIVVTDLPEGQYVWSVRALANVDTKGNVGAMSDKSEMEFTLDRNAMFTPGTGFVALSTMFTSYTYFAFTPGRSQLSTSSLALTVRASGEYWLFPQLGLSAGVEDTFFQINSKLFTRLTAELHAKYRMSLDSSRFGWFLAPKAGVEFREYFELLPQVTGSGRNRTINLDQLKASTLGPSVGFDIRKQLAEKWSLGGKVAYYYPVMLFGVPGGKITNELSTRNLSVGLQGLYFFRKQWSLAAGGYFDMRSISFQKAGATQSDQVKMDGLYFFGSLIYSFGFK